jgi:2-oxoglutarate dehydrogenase E2 component (dihydrolipoamide succinyltransferase)
MSTDVVVPTLGESIAEATLGQWLKKPGDPVKADEPIASLETDKVAVEVPSPVAGAMGEQLVAEGQTVAVGALIARIENGAGAAAAQPAGPRRLPLQSRRWLSRTTRRFHPLRAAR